MKDFSGVFNLLGKTTVNFVRLEKTVTGMWTGCSRMMKSCIFALFDKKQFLVNNKKMGLCLYI